MIIFRSSIITVGKFHFRINCNASECIDNLDTSVKVKFHKVISFKTIKVVKCINRTLSSGITSMCKFINAFSSVCITYRNIIITRCRNKKNLSCLRINHCENINITSAYIRYIAISVIS